MTEIATAQVDIRPRAKSMLPTSSDQNTWNPEERALVEAAGLVHTDAQTGQKTLADRATVAAFLQHCARTGLDPIARQIYSIARKSKGQLKWQIQISIDGARLVAERSGQYEGQTTPEFTADGITWTQVWLSPEPPKAARVGVYRRGFRDALYAVALWDAYVQTTFKGEVTEMWRKMGPLMLAKCAEMLALRKAFPQDLSGLYSAEEMDQASTPATPVSEPQASAQPAAVEVRRPSRDWLADANAARSRDELRPVYQAAQDAGDLDVALADGRTLKQFLWELRDSLPETVEDVQDAEVVEEPAAEPLVDWPVAAVPKGDQS